MALKLSGLIIATLPFVVSSAAAQGVLTERNISLAMAKTIAETALERCKKDGSRVTVIVLDRGGNIRVVLRTTELRHTRSKTASARPTRRSLFALHRENWPND